MNPVLQALVMADRVYTDADTGKKIIAGTFSGVLLQRQLEAPIEELPDGTKKRKIMGGTDPGCPYAYISLTDVVDQTDITLQFVNVSKNKVMFEAPIRITCNDRLATVEIVAPLPPLLSFLTEPGTFSLDVVCGGEILGSHRITVKQQPEA